MHMYVCKQLQSVCVCLCVSGVLNVVEWVCGVGVRCAMLEIVLPLTFMHQMEILQNFPYSLLVLKLIVVSPPASFSTKFNIWG